MADYFESGIGKATLHHPEQDHAELGREAASEALSQIKQFQPCLAMAFVSSELDIPGITKGIKEMIKECPLIGTGTAAAIANGFAANSVVVCVLASPHIRVRIGAGNNVSQNFQTAVSESLSDAGINQYFDYLHPQHQMLRMASGGTSGNSPVLLIVFSPGSTTEKYSSSHDIHSVLRKSSANRIPIFGGSSSDFFHYGPNYQIINNRVLNDAIVLAFLETDVLFGLGMAHGFIPTKKQVMVTRASGHFIHEFDKRPAVDVYAELLKMDPLHIKGNFQVGVPPFKQFPLGSVDMYGNSILHVPERLLDDGSIQFAHVIENSRVMSLMRAKDDEVLNAGVAAYNKAVLYGGLNKPSSIIMLSCALRMKNQAEQEDLRRVRENANLSFCGLYSYGEKGVLDDGLPVYNNHSVSTLVFSDELNPIASLVNKNKNIYEKFNDELEKKALQIKSISKMNEVIQNETDVGRLLTSLTSELAVSFPWAYGAFYLSEGQNGTLALASAVDFEKFPDKIQINKEQPGFLYIHLDSHEKSFGVMVLRVKDSAVGLNEEDIQLARTIGKMAANGLHQIELDSHLNVKLRQLEILNQIGNELSKTEENGLQSENILNHIKRSLKLSFVSLWLIDRTHQLLTKEAITSNEDMKIGQVEKENDERLARWQIEHEKPLFYTNEPGMMHPIQLIAPFNFSFVSLPIKLKGELRGILNLFSLRQYKWSLQTERIFENMEFLQNISTQIAMFIENRSLHKHTTLYKEIHHRVKNNLQNIASLLRMQRRRLDSITADQALSDSIARIMSIAMVHDTLSQSEIGLVDLHRLMDSIIKFCESEASHKINITLDVSDTLTMIPSREATTLSLVVNELVLNAIQHGVKGRENGKLQIIVEQKNDISVTIIDDGPGLPDAFDAKKDGNLGLTIVQTLVKDELKGHFEINGSSGTRAYVCFPTPKSCYPLQKSENKIKLHKEKPKTRFGKIMSKFGGNPMTKESALKDKVILIVDDEADILETVQEELSMCLLHKAQDYDTAKQYLASYTYDIVILDIMGVDGFELLKDSVHRGFPTTMLTAHALTPEALKQSIKLGAVFFLPKEKLFELKEFLETAVLKEKKASWSYFFDTFGKYLSNRFGPDWKEKDKFFKEFEKSISMNKKD
ncbi:FIST N-terminal domain-containing protein [Desulfobacula sp.]|uniref:FIST N-terminal domain-containing protein n=1 Tax=Desulfobacula sp. TaxID=2593537 RepID=UPI00261C8212|nr:FIST N-terminal domain-containing protein [Desulfobacula sp.]